MTINIPLFGSIDLPNGVTRPTWVVLDISGAYPERQSSNPIQAMLNRTETIESLAARAEQLQKADWLHGVLVRFSDLSSGPATAYAIRSILKRLAEHKRVVAYLPQMNMTTLIAASGASELVAPESADVMLSGFGLEQTYLGKFLKKHGIEFENLRIKEYKAALTTFSEEHMDSANREQLTAYIEGLEHAWVKDMAEAREVSEEQARAWLEADFTSAQAAKEAGLLTKVAYEDELIGPGTRPMNAVMDLLMPKEKNNKAGRIAVVSVVGSIVPGKSRNNPVPLPLLGGPMAGSDTVVAALKRAKNDKQTKAIVVYVNSGGGSAMASDLMHREIATSEKPVVVVMGEYAASGGYYLATHAKHIVAAPYTLTGSIGVVSGKPVMTEFNKRHGLNPEAVGRPTALKYSSSQAFSENERQGVEKAIAEVYDRFITRVAEGREMTKERVNELGRGRIWIGKDALEHGLVDELGDLQTGVERAIELAGLSYDAPIWNVAPKRSGLLPEFAEEVEKAAKIQVWPFGQERVLTWLDQEIRVK